MLSRFFFITVISFFAITSPIGAQTLPFNEEESAARLESLMARLNKHGATLDGGAERLAYSDEDIKAREVVISEMARVGLRVRIDAAGNIIGTRPGQSMFKEPIVMGSHMDTVKKGGRFDGVAGIAAAIEVVELMNARDRRTAYPLEIVVFQNEEGGLIGSLAWLGKLSEETLAIISDSGFTVRDGIKRIGGRPDDLLTAIREPGSIKAFLELHIEQGATLHDTNRDIGIVTGIVGIKLWDVTINGVANHAGSTPMDKRQDALLAAADYVKLVNKAANGFDGRQVATVGKLEAFPGAPNVIPGQVRASLEIRDIETSRIDTVFKKIREGIPAIEASTGTKFSFDYVDVASEPALMNKRMQEMIERKVQLHRYGYQFMPSGAGHDAQDMVSLAPTGMIFVPSINGISHSPNERTDFRALAKGARILMDSVLGIDALQVN